MIRKYSLSAIYQTLLLLIFGTLLFSCTDSSKTQEGAYYSDEMIMQLEKINEQQKRRDSVIYLIDSLYKTNPLTGPEQFDKKYEIELLKKDNRNQQNKTRSAIIIGMLLTLLALISHYLLWRLRSVMKKRSRVYKRLVASEKELKETMLQKETAEKALRENELLAQEMRLQMEFNDAIIRQRSQISDDMHDELSNSLAALKFYVEDEKNKSVGTTAEKSLAAIAEEVDTLYLNARTYMHNLKTNNWETRLSLTGFLKELQQKFSEKGLMTIHLKIDEEKIKSSLSASQHDQLYHICSEAITNIIKHARASNISIQIVFKGENCYFSIADNGAGFSENGKGGLGLNSIKKRALSLGGIINFESGKAGTLIKGEFTLSN